MRKAFLTVLIILLVCVSAVFADDDLLRRSIMACTYAELVQMGKAYGIDTSADEQTLRNSILAFFGVESADSAQSATEEVGKVTSISIDHADRMDTVGDVVVMSGGVRVTFTAESTGKRTLVADAVAIDLESKILQASGEVVMEDKDGDQRTFRGQIVNLDWGSLDVVVFDGVSTTTRTNSTGTGILFYVSGKEISYDGESSGVFFNNGTIATWNKDPYWSISAKKLSLSGNDLFIDRAVFRLGRVPVFYFPVFFYPGTTLSFNPSIGMSSSKGAFMTTTYEVYGQYPKLGKVGSKSSASSSSSDSEEESAVSGFASFFETENNATMIRDGLYYRPVSEGEELSPLEQWARNTGSYFAAFADVYQNLGLAMGFDTMNSLFDKHLEIGAVGVAAYRPVEYTDNFRRFRYSFDFNLNYKLDNLKITAKMPVRSDPAVRVDFLNRNTSFVLDSLLGTTQYFPNTYSSQTTYTWSLDSSYKTSVGKYNFNISSLKADIDYKLVKKKDTNGKYYYEPEVVEASLPYLSLSSDGVFVDLKGESTSRTKTIDYSNDLAFEFSQEQASLSEEQPSPSPQEPNGNGLSSYSGPDLKLEQTSVSEAGSFKVGYTYNQTLDNVYKTSLARDNFYTKINGSVYVDASVPGNWFKVTETLKPQFNLSQTDMSSGNPVNVDEFYLSSVLAASVPKLGISYNLKQRIFVHYSKSNPATKTDRWGEWDSTDVTAHNVSISKTWTPFTVGFYVQLKPLAEILKPSLSYSRSGFNASADFSMKRPSGQTEFDKDVANLNLSYKNGLFSASVANKYDFTKVKEEGTDPWKGYTLVQKFSITPLKGLSFSENATYTEKFVASNLSVSGEYSLDTSVVDLTASSSLRFTGENYDKDTLKVGLKLSQDRIRFWKKRVSLESAVDFSFNYDFSNQFSSYLTAGLSLKFSIAEFLDLGITIKSANKSFSRYYTDEGKFSFQKMLDDLLKSFDFFGTGRRSTGFNLSSFKVQMVHYMRDWNLYIDAQGNLTTQYPGKYEWVPSVTVYVKWNAIPELKTQGAWDSDTKEWT